TAQTLLIHATVVSPNSQTNTASITHSDQFDPDPGNNSASATATPQQADLAVGKTVSDSTPNVGDVISYFITVNNAGPDSATGVVVNDLLPAGMSFVGVTPGQGTYDSATGLWTIGTMPSGSAVVLVLRAQVNSPDPQFNVAAISQADQFDPNTGNNS